MGITLLDMLLNAGLITRDHFNEALKNRVLYGGKIGTSLIELGYIGENELARFLSSKLAVPFIAAERLLAIQPHIIELVPQDIAVRYRVIPLHREKKRLYLVMSDPADLKAIDDISFITGFIIKPVVAPEVRLIQALGKYYGYGVDQRYLQIVERMEEIKHKEQPPPPPSPAPTAEEPPRVAEVPPALSLPDEAELEEVELVDDEEWLKRVTFYSIDEISKTLAWARDRDEIATIIIDYLRHTFDRAALFVIRGDEALGWKGVNHGIDIGRLENLVIPLGEPSVLRTVAEGAGYYLGSIADVPMNSILLDQLGGGRPACALLLPLVISGRVVNILYLEGGKETLGDHFMELHRLLTKAVLAFEILIFREKILML